MRIYRTVILSGLFWISGPVWADESVCIAHRRMAQAIAEVRAAGTPEVEARAALLTAQTAPALRGLVDSTIAMVYASDQPPAALAAQAETLCRQTFPAPP